MGKSDVTLKAPCKDCKYRTLGCHDKCFMYKEWKNQARVKKEMEEKDRDIDEYWLKMVRKNSKKH